MEQFCKRSRRLSVAFFTAVCLSIGLSNATPVAAQGKIAFGTTRNGDHDIYLMNPDGTEQTRLTTDPARDHQPSFSSDGSKILFYSTRDGTTAEIYVMNADGSGQTRLTNHPGNDFNPSFSPDGNNIVFHSNRDGDFEIYIMNSDGTGVTPLTENNAFDVGASFSPDGSKIVFASNRDTNSPDYEIYVMNADGTGQTRLTQNTAFDSGPSFSPDGSKIAFYSSRDGNNEIYLMNADGSELTRLTNSSGRDTDPVFSPDGSKIAFTSFRDGHEEIYVMNVDGSGQTALTNNLADDAGAAWGRSASSPGRLLNLSTRVEVRAGEEVLIGGVIITGNEPKKLIMRAVGNSLGESFPNRLVDPTLTLHDSTGEIVAFNDDWTEAPEPERTEIENSGVAPTDSRDPAILRTLNPGSYTAIVRGKDNTTGLAVVELYDLNAAADARLANLSTRGFVTSDPNLLIGGFITAGDTQIVVRGIGPSLAQANVPTPLGDPLLSIHDANGAQVASNDNWMNDPNSSTIQNLGLAPRDNREAALLLTPPAGATTAVLRGNNDTTGNALIEIYDVTPRPQE